MKVNLFVFVFPCIVYDAGFGEKVAKVVYIIIRIGRSIISTVSNRQGYRITHERLMVSYFQTFRFWFQICFFHLRSILLCERHTVGDAPHRRLIILQ